MLEQGRLACGRGCQSVCGPHMQDAAQICFFAHSPEEVRHPSTKPFVPPEALAAATTGATLEAVRQGCRRQRRPQEGGARRQLMAP